MDDLKQLFMRRVAEIHDVDVCARNVLRREGAHFFIQLLSLTESDVSRMLGIGKKHKRDIAQSVRDAGFDMGVLKDYQPKLMLLWPYAARTIGSERQAGRIVNRTLEEHPEIMDMLGGKRTAPVAAASAVPVFH